MIKKIKNISDITKKQYKNVWEVITRYWTNYGSLKAILTSPYFHFALIISFICFPYSAYKDNEMWWHLPISILPNLIGFSLGGYAIFLAFGDAKFKKFIAYKEEDDKISSHIVINTTFLHFILIQILALIFSIIGETVGYESVPLRNNYEVFSWFYGLFSYSLFCYAVCLAIATTFALYRLICMYDEYLRTDNNK